MDHTLKSRFGGVKSRAIFIPGTRVRYTTYPYQMASLPGGMYMHLGAVQAVSAVVLPGTPEWLQDLLYIRPDGWPAPIELSPQGFGAQITRLQIYDGTDLLAPITNGVGVPYPPEEIQCIIAEKMKGI